MSAESVGLDVLYFIAFGLFALISKEHGAEGDVRP
jgi:hypothetical protein